MIIVEIREYVIYSKTYPRKEVIGLLTRNGWRDIGDLTDAELADLVEQERPGVVEEDLQRNGEVLTSAWACSVGSEE